MPFSIFHLLNLGEYFSQKKQLIATIFCWIALCGLVIIFFTIINFHVYLSKKNISSIPEANIFASYHKPELLQRDNFALYLNVIWIFVESLEQGYKDKEILAKLEDATQFMTPLWASPLINKYTIGGMLSAKCGAPIYLPTLLHQNLLTSAAFNRAICYDDVLRINDYNSFF